jgi:hypothetical protein
MYKYILGFFLILNPFVFAQIPIMDINHRLFNFFTEKEHQKYQKEHDSITSLYKKILMTNLLFTMSTGKGPLGIDLPVPMASLDDCTKITEPNNTFTHKIPSSFYRTFEVIRHPIKSKYQKDKRKAFMNYLKETYKLSIQIIERAKNANLLDASQKLTLIVSHNLLVERLEFYANKVNQYIEEEN